MRMRRKNNLDMRIEQCSSYLLCRLYFANYKNVKQLDFNKIFNNSNPVWLEIGCGKGNFINTIAKQLKNINFLAIEKNENVIISAMEKTFSEKISNIRYINGLAEYLDFIIPQKSIERIYLNFSCPFPKKIHEKHRLTSKSFLDVYKRLLCENGSIIQKTDNIDFFEYSQRSFSENNFILRNVSYDLHNSDITGNIKTEYEDFFSSKRVKINYLEAFIK